METWLSHPQKELNFLQEQETIHGCFKRQRNFEAAIAQLRERKTEDLKVPGSIPGSDS